MSYSQTKKMSYAAIVKSQPNKRTNKPARPKSWYEQTEESEMESIRHSNSLSMFFSDDVQSNVTRHSEHSLDSGQISDMSSDNEDVSGQSPIGNDNTRQNGTTQKEFQRSESLDSCGTLSSTLSTNNNPMEMLRQLWSEIKVKREKAKHEIESDEGVLVRRQKQIDYGKNTDGYKLYTEQVPNDQRTIDHPVTPDKHRKYSRRAFDGLIKKWRKQLHTFDPSHVDSSDDHDEVSSDQPQSSDEDNS